MSNTQVCPTCGVKIEGNVVHFSAGPSGSRDRLYTRVCQYTDGARAKGCINKNAEVKEGEGYSDAPSISMPAQ